MTNEAQFQTTTVVESKNPSADLATIGANTTVGGIFGLNANVAETNLKRWVIRLTLVK
jgi:hypothetical protein